MDDSASMKRNADHASSPLPASRTPITCTFCGSMDTEQLSYFGTQLSTRQCYCRSCHTYFQWMTREPEPEN